MVPPPGARKPGSPGEGGCLKKESWRFRLAGLRDQRLRLEREVEEAEALLAVANADQAPYAEVFHLTDATLRQLHADRKAGGVISKIDMLAAYDARMEAGHAWNPFRAKAQELAGWLKALRHELKAVNQEIGT